MTPRRRVADHRLLSDYESAPPSSSYELRGHFPLGRLRLSDNRPPIYTRLGCEEDDRQQKWIFAFPITLNIDPSHRIDEFEALLLPLIPLGAMIFPSPGKQEGLALHLDNTQSYILIVSSSPFFFEW